MTNDVILPENISSSEDLAALIMEVRSYAKWYSQVANARKIGANHKDSQPALTDTATITIRSAAEKDSLAPEQLDGLISDLERIYKRAQTLTITLAAPAPADVRREIVSWVRSNISTDALINFRFNSQIVGGMVVRIGSKIYDWSFRKAILENKSKLAETLNRV